MAQIQPIALNSSRLRNFVQSLQLSCKFQQTHFLVSGCEDCKRVLGKRLSHLPTKPTAEDRRAKQIPDDVGKLFSSRWNAKVSRRLKNTLLPQNTAAELLKLADNR